MARGIQRVIVAKAIFRHSSSVLLDFSTRVADEDVIVDVGRIGRRHHVGSG
ncbi:MAG: hypothetical protein KJ065_04585 [Anaerolineae bacterium]|nr:hypothetical protein [Anaerolineae bacterium]